ncbi:hypothetical protein EUX98_g9666 [Antrodiella citrinella]|uniref:Uncharacterized protein n=1 Tax=Antrodiella citrinella TaxID=2447956 RepID=A0A4S4LNZ6_9APHY|nr:hypothetical protein EUX98_g9666 [Antrodiella citrinella]
MKPLIPIVWKYEILKNPAKRAFVELHIHKNARIFPSWTSWIFVTDPPHRSRGPGTDKRNHCDVVFHDAHGKMTKNEHIVVPKWPKNLKTANKDDNDSN